SARKGEFHFLDLAAAVEHKFFIRHRTSILTNLLRELSCKVARFYQALSILYSKLNCYVNMPCKYINSPLYFLPCLSLLRPKKPFARTARGARVTWSKKNRTKKR